MKAWSRTHTVSVSSDAKERLNNLMTLLKSEIEGGERINLTVLCFSWAKKKSPELRKNKGYTNVNKHLPTAATLLRTSSKPNLRRNCLFIAENICVQKASRYER